MFIVYNLMGLLVGVLGLVLAGFAIVKTGFVTAGLVILAIIWCLLGRKNKAGVAPSVFFIPLFYWGILAGILAVPAYSIDVVNNETDVQFAPQKAAFASAEDGLDTNATDAPEISDAVLELLATIAPPEYANVTVQSSVDSVLILIQLEYLKEIPVEDREILLRAVERLAQAERPGVQVYTGIKGRISYGAILTPGDGVDVGSVVSDTPLLAFFRQAKVVAQASEEGAENVVESEQEMAPATD